MYIPSFVWMSIFKLNTIKRHLTHKENRNIITNSKLDWYWNIFVY